MGYQDKIRGMPQSIAFSLVDVLDDESLTDQEIRRLVGWQSLILVDLLRRKCITIRYAEKTLFNLKVVTRLEQRHLDDCAELIDFGMQLEDWEEHTPEQIGEALETIVDLAQHLIRKQQETVKQVGALEQDRRS